MTSLCGLAYTPYHAPFFLPCYFSSKNYFYLTMLFSNLAKKFCSRELLVIYVFALFFHAFHTEENIKTVDKFNQKVNSLYFLICSGVFIGKKVLL